MPEKTNPHILKLKGKKNVCPKNHLKESENLRKILRENTHNISRWQKTRIENT